MRSSKARYRARPHRHPAATSIHAVRSPKIAVAVRRPAARSEPRPLRTLPFRRAAFVVARRVTPGGFPKPFTEAALHDDCGKWAIWVGNCRCVEEKDNLANQRASCMNELRARDAHCAIGDRRHGRV